MQLIIWILFKKSDDTLKETNLKSMDASNPEQIDRAKNVPLLAKSNPNKDIAPPANLIQIEM